MWMKRVNARQLMLNALKQWSVWINLRIGRQNYGLMTCKVKLIKHAVFYFFIKATQRCVHHEWGDKLSQAAKSFIKSEHPNLPLSSRGVAFLPGLFLAIPRRYIHAAAPTLMRGGSHWRVPLNKQNVDRSRTQEFNRRSA